MCLTTEDGLQGQAAALVAKENALRNQDTRLFKLKERPLSVSNETRILVGISQGLAQKPITQNHAPT